MQEFEPWLWRLMAVKARADAWFDSIDTNGDGVISFAELSEHLTEKRFAPRSIERIFDLLDLNGDGDISKEMLRQSFVQYEDPALRLALGLGAPDADAVFDAIDTDGDGEISRGELLRYLELTATTGAGPAKSAATLFRTLDADGNGRISRAELREGFGEDAAFRQALGLS